MGLKTPPDKLLAKLSGELESEGLKALVRLGPKDSVVVQPDPPLPSILRRRLAAKGIQGLWTHQEEALEAAREGRDVIVSTGTASGKSLCFNLPVFESLLQDQSTRALYLYPTKALAQDQLRAIRSFGLPQVTAATYDGDTPQDERPSVRKFAAIVLTNPDMLHFGILPTHARWAEFFAHLKLIVVDEAHVLRGIFGSHVGCILRRTLRLAEHYGATPAVVMTSATIGNPGHLASGLIGRPFTVVDRDGAPRGERFFAFWNPPFVDEELGIRGSANWEAARLMAAFVDDDVRTLAFSRSRKGAELIAKYARQMTPDTDRAELIRSYRAGYLAEERRQIEQQLFGGELLGVAATSALELGIDVGGLGAVVMSGFPGTVAQVWQQAGRAGRGNEGSVAVLVGQDDPLDQYYIAHPRVLLEKPYEAALVDTTNPNVAAPHLASAVFELPMERDEMKRHFGAGAEVLADKMVAAGDFVIRKTRSPDVERFHWKRQQPPARDLDIRSIGGASYSIVEAATGALLGTVDGARAYHQVHQGAIYLHHGENLEVEELDLHHHVALVGPSKGNYYTQAREISDLRVLETIGTKPVGKVEFSLGRVEVTERVVSFVRKDITTGETLAIVDLDLPEVVLETVAFWYTVQADVITQASIGAKELPGSLHAAEHAAIGILPLFAMADRWDIGGLSTALSAETAMPTVFIYDGYPGGAGIAERGFAEAAEHLGATLEAVTSCPCEKGCPSCVQSPKCGNGNEPLDKHGAIRLMRAILSR